MTALLLVGDDHMHRGGRVLDWVKVESSVTVPGGFPGQRESPVAALQGLCYGAVMKSKIRKHDSGLDISVEQVGDRQRALLDAFLECQ